MSIRQSVIKTTAGSLPRAHLAGGVIMSERDDLLAEIEAILAAPLGLSAAELQERVPHTPEGACRSCRLPGPGGTCAWCADLDHEIAMACVAERRAQAMAGAGRAGRRYPGVLLTAGAGAGRAGKRHPGVLLAAGAGLALSSLAWPAPLACVAALAGVALAWLAVLLGARL